ncbi:MAG: hypothetical protein R8K46_07645 [Mariprofundaceae bacterium]
MIISADSLPVSFITIEWPGCDLPVATISATAARKIGSMEPVHFNVISSGESVCPDRTHVTIRGVPLARPHFKFEKRQKELAKQKKAEEKRLRKLEKRGDTASEETPEPITDDTSSE